MKLLEFEKPIDDIEKRIEELKKLVPANPQLKEEIKALEEHAERIKKRIYENLTPWQKVQLARHPERPHAFDFIKAITENFVELHGDRLFGDDPAVIAGIGKIDGLRLAIIGEEKGRETKERMKRNFGMPHPEGYRKAIRIFLLADRFKLPVLTLIDTPGAYPGVGAEERGQAWAIAESISTMLTVKVPIVSVVIGEGGSGGALAISVSDRIYMLKYSIYSVISPEGCASILWRDGKLAPRAAEVLKLTSEDLLSFGIIDGIIEEPLEGAHRNPELVYRNVKKKILESFEELCKFAPSQLLSKRRERYKKIGKLIG